MDKPITITNEKEKQISVKKYDSVDFEGFVNGYEIVWLNGKSGFINENYEEICPIKYDVLFPFRNLDYPTRCQFHGKYGLINKNGIEICPIKYDRIDPFNGDGLAFAESGDMMCYLDKNGKEITII